MGNVMSTICMIVQGFPSEALFWTWGDARQNQMTFSVAEKKRKAHQPLKNLSLYSPKNDRHNDQRNEIGIIYIYPVLASVPGPRYPIYRGKCICAFTFFVCKLCARDGCYFFFCSQSQIAGVSRTNKTQDTTPCGANFLLRYQNSRFSSQRG